jgi:ferredoxin
MTMARRLRLDPIACDGYGCCHELLPEMIRLDRWGFPIVDDGPVPPELMGAAKRAARLCPALALALERVPEKAAAGSRSP